MADQARALVANNLYEQASTRQSDKDATPLFFLDNCSCSLTHRGPHRTPYVMGFHAPRALSQQRTIHNPSCPVQVIPRPPCSMMTEMHIS